MDSAEIKKLRGLAEHVACQKGFARDREDLAQDALLTAFVKPERADYVDTLIIDAIRDMHGRDNTGVGYGLKGFVNRVGKEVAAFERMDAGDQAGQLEAEIDYASLLPRIDRERDRAMIVLRLEWGLSLREIGHVLGLTESRISQELEQAIFRLRRNLVRAGDVPPEKSTAPARLEVGSVFPTGMRRQRAPKAVS